MSHISKICMEIKRKKKSVLVFALVAMKNRDHYELGRRNPTLFGPSQKEDEEEVANKCGVKMSKDDLTKENRRYWNITESEQDAFIRSTARLVPLKRRNKSNFFNDDSPKWNHSYGRRSFAGMLKVLSEL